MSAYVALVTIDLHFPEAHSLKAKRSELNAIKSVLRQRHGMAVAEVDHQDLWQRSTLAGALVSGSLARLEESYDRMRDVLDARLPQGVGVRATLASFEELEGLG